MTSSDGSKITLPFGIKFEGPIARQVWGNAGWIVAILVMMYSAWGPPSKISGKQDLQAKVTVSFIKHMDRRMHALEVALKIPSPEPLDISMIDIKP